MKKNLEKIKNLRADDLIYFGYRVEPYFAAEIILIGMLNRKALKEIFDWETGVRWLQVNYYFYQIKEDLILMESELRKSFQEKGLSYVNSVVQQCIEYGELLQKVSKELAEKSNATNDRDGLSQLLEQYFVAMTRYTAFYSVAMFERPLMELAQELVKRKTNNSEGEQELFDLITTSSRETVVEYEQEDFLKLAASLDEQKEKLIKDHAQKYGWLSIRFFVGKPWTFDDVSLRLKNVDSQKAKIELDRRLKERKDREEKISEAIKSFSLEDKEIVSQIREIVFLRNQRADYYNESAYHIRPLLEKIATVLGVTYIGLLNLSTLEILSALNGKLDNYKDFIKNRSENFIVYHSGADSFIIDGEEAKNFLQQNPFLIPKQENVKEVSGKVGYKGKVTGIVKVVKLEKDISKVEKGDILVAPMTIPNFMPAMENAIAFVTDEGGITCHAAIIAREMQKPCIIGTKIGTQVFKDGDLVEVDAEKGIVKIL